MDTSKARVVNVASKKADNWNIDDILMYSLCNFYKKEDNLEKFLSIVGRTNSNIKSSEDPADATSPISRRVLDWFVTGYASRHKIVYDLNDPIFNHGKESDEIIPFNVHKEYKSQLKSFQKRNFDTFCRRERIDFYYDVADGEDFKETTVGQLNFFRWAISYKVIDYVLEYLSEIEEDMNNWAFEKDKTKTKPKKSKRTATASTTASTTLVERQSPLLNKKRIHNITASRDASKKETIIRIKFN
jgi:hypothetical protein